MADHGHAPAKSGGGGHGGGGGGSIGAMAIPATGWGLIQAGLGISFSWYLIDLAVTTGRIYHVIAGFIMMLVMSVIGVYFFLPGRIGKICRITIWAFTSGVVGIAIIKLMISFADYVPNPKAVSHRTAFQQTNYDIFNGVMTLLILAIPTMFFFIAVFMFVKALIENPREEVAHGH